MDTSFPALLATLKTSLESAISVLPTEDSIVPPKDAISLLDVKNELLLSYLQNLAFLIYMKIRNGNHESDEEEEGEPLEDLAVKKLVELRVWLEKGVKPLEGRLKYQIDKVLRAADDASRASQQKAKAAGKITSKSQSKTANGTKDDDSDASESEDDDEDDSEAEIDELSYRPNPASFARTQPAAKEKLSAKEKKSDGIYKPPRITPTALPTTQTREARRPEKSATLDEFVANELSTAPMAEPSVGSTIAFGGRRMKSQKERKEEVEKQEYEEANFVRLPKENKKDRAKKGAARGTGFGGEEWRGISAGVDRIERLTKRKGGREATVDRSRKRATEDGPRGDGTSFGGSFENK
ncbi:hypothetical protein K402DRAFT_305414, partial [Aulographum hederae CBS 113979]